MKVERLCSNRGQLLEGPLLLTPKVFEDDRGFFYESWNVLNFQNALIDDGWSKESAKSIQFFQDNHSRSKCGVLRGLHFQLPPVPQGKLVRCSLGLIFDVAVDLRLNSSTFGDSVAVELSASNYQQLWIPEGFAHGFLTLSEIAEVQYKATNFWSKECERSLHWQDTSLSIHWPLQRVGMNYPVLTSKDEAALSLKEFQTNGELF